MFSSVRNSQAVYKSGLTVYFTSHLSQGWASLIWKSEVQNAPKSKTFEGPSVHILVSEFWIWNFLVWVHNWTGDVPCLSEAREGLGSVSSITVTNKTDITFLKSFKPDLCLLLRHFRRVTCLWVQVRISSSLLALTWQCYCILSIRKAVKWTRCVLNLHNSNASLSWTSFHVLACHFQSHIFCSGL